MEDDTFLEPWDEDDDHLRGDYSAAEDEDEEDYYDDEHLYKKGRFEATPAPPSAFDKLQNYFDPFVSPPPKRSILTTPPPGRSPKFNGANGVWSPSDQCYVPRPGTEKTPPKQDLGLERQQERIRKGGMSPFSSTTAATWTDILPTLLCEKVADEWCQRTGDTDCPGCAICARLFCSLCIQRGEQNSFVTGCDGFHHANFRQIPS